jgi:chaperone BCS1
MLQIHRIVQSLLPGSLAAKTILTLLQSSNVGIAFTTIYTFFQLYHYLSRTISLFASICIGESQQIYPFIVSWASQRFRYRSEVEVADNAQADVKTLNTTRFMPVFGSFFFSEDGRIFMFVRTQGESSSQAGEGQEARIILKTFGRSTNPIRELLDKIIRNRSQQNLQHINIWMLRANATKFFGNPWTLSTPKLPRMLDTVVLDENTKQTVVDQIDAFLSSDGWYMERGIPWRIGYLFHGPPGTGKTSFASALAAALSLNVYMFSLTENDTQDSDLIRFLQHVPERSIVLLEDIDSSASTLKRPASNLNDSRTVGQENRSNISLAGLLNCLDGSLSPEGVIYIVTTNHPDKLDEALIRPGRVDHRIHFTKATRYQAKTMFMRMYADPQADMDKLQELGCQFADAIPEVGLSPAEIQGFLITKKHGPHKAVECVAAWVQESQERAGKDVTTATKDT